MKRQGVTILYLCMFFGLIIFLPSCKVKEGCGLEEKYNNPDMETTKRGKSSLFSKSQMKKMKKN
ncbi:MAG TPA: hypothetical protein PKD16_12750 [Saprospiraceae bacterium]|nr:hypothetical protein [Saprospiraceae bacterium]MBK8827140.1 hypothetical protein [Saprospiraceae bacterium]MBP6538834.1 hypothetical protein [Saprospiraceae bacterium]HMT54069.1 hypothetical protein [Saprospiraceae bacterium]HMT71029.1 hypothetical protein [Saprospiraceae bacterium]